MILSWKNSYWTVGDSVGINIWNDLWCSARCISLLASVPYIVQLHFCHYFSSMG